MNIEHNLYYFRSKRTLPSLAMDVKYTTNSSNQENRELTRKLLNSQKIHFKRETFI